MGPIDGISFPPCVDPARLARDIIDALVRDLKLRPGGFVYERALGIAFAARGLKAENIACALEHAQQPGWLAFDPVQRVYTLTHAGFGII